MAYVPASDLTLCIVIGDLLENALEACRRVSGARLIRVQARWMDDHLMTMVGNSYNGQTTQRGGRILSSKKDEDLGTFSIWRILNHPGDKLGVDYDGATFTAMVKTMDQAMAE